MSLNKEDNSLKTYFFWSLFHGEFIFVILLHSLSDFCNSRNLSKKIRIDLRGWGKRLFKAFTNNKSKIKIFFLTKSTPRNLMVLTRNPYLL